MVEGSGSLKIVKWVTGSGEVLHPMGSWCCPALSARMGKGTGKILSSLNKTMRRIW